MRITNIIDGYLEKKEDGLYRWSFNAMTDDNRPVTIEYSTVELSINIPSSLYNKQNLNITPMISMVEEKPIIFSITEY